MRMRIVRHGGRLGLAAFAATAAMVAGALPASAEPGDGSAYGLDVQVTLLGGIVVDTGQIVVANADGDTEESLATVNVPGVLSTGVVNASASRDDATGHVQSRASTADVSTSVLGISATAIEANCLAEQSGVTGSSTLVDLDLGPIGDVPANPAPNTVLTVEIAGIHIATLTFNEQISNPDGSLTVNALHIQLIGGVLGSLGEGDIVISSATCGPAAPPVPMASGAGLWISLGVIALVVVPAGIAIANRRRTSTTTV
jgi:hypothetical protein